MKSYKDILGMGRVANLPSVLSNVLTGVVLAFFPGGEWFEESIPYLKVFAVSLSACFLYFGACILNDWHDAAWDAKNRPERPIPQGRVKRNHAYYYALSSLFLGIVISFLVSQVVGYISVALLLSVLCYTVLHKRTLYSIPFMAFCRALLYPLGYFSIINFEMEANVYDPILRAASGLFLPCLALFCYILAISLTARKEKPKRSSVILKSSTIYLLLPFIFLGVLALIRENLWPLFFIAALIYSCGVLYGLRLQVTKPDKTRWLLAAIPLIDLMVLAIVPVTWPFLLIPLFSRIIGRELQNFTPAT